MPDAHHFDDVALRHKDPLTRFLEDAVDAADAGAPMPEPKRSPPPKRSHAAKAGVPMKASPGSVTKRLRVWFTDEDYAGIMECASRKRMVVNDVVRIAVREWMEAHRERGGNTRDAAASADTAGNPPRGGAAGSVAQVPPSGA